MEYIGELEYSSSQGNTSAYIFTPSELILRIGISHVVQLVYIIICPI